MKKQINTAPICVIVGLFCIVLSYFIKNNNVATFLLFFVGVIIMVPCAVVCGIQQRRRMSKAMKDMMTQQIGENMERAAAMGKSTVTPESEEIARQMRENMARARELEKERGK